MKLIRKIWEFFNGNVSLGRRQDADYHLGTSSKPRPFPSKLKNGVDISKIKTIKDLLEVFK